MFLPLARQAGCVPMANLVLQCDLRFQVTEDEKFAVVGVTSGTSIGQIAWVDYGSRDVCSFPVRWQDLKTTACEGNGPGYSVELLLAGRSEQVAEHAIVFDPLWI